MAKHDMVRDPVASVLLKMTGPMAVAMLGFLVFNLVDTFYVGQLGGQELAAMAFTFPVVFMVMSLSFGLGAGASAVIARAQGAGETSVVRRLTTDAIMLSVVVVVIVSTLGLLFLDPIFRALGAEGDFLDLVREYMVVWFAGVALVVLPMTGNNAIRALGDAKTPAKIMLVATVTNLVLDPIFIFGLGPVPRMELQGAAIATVIAFGVTFVAAFWVLGRREHLLVPPRISTLPDSWKRILQIGVPAAFTSMLAPIATAWLTRVAATLGPDVVAAFGVGLRIEGLGLIAVNAMGSVLTPFMGQNLGAQAWPRIRAAQAFAFRFSAAWGFAIAAVLAAAAWPLARLFTPDLGVQAATALLLLVVPISWFAAGWNNLAANAANGLGRPRDAVALNLVRLIAVVAASSAGAAIADLPGFLAGIVAANLAAGAFAVWMNRWTRRSCRLETTSGAAPLTA